MLLARTGWETCLPSQLLAWILRRRAIGLGLETRIANVCTAAIRFHQEVYRSAAPRYATARDLLTGEGAGRFGGRWNPAGVAAVYGSLTPQCALEETLAHARYYGLPINTSMPRTFVAIETQLSHVLDLTDGSLRRSLRVSERKLLDCDWRAEAAAGRIPITQQVGGLAASAGLEAILVRSAADHSGFNLVVFPENLRSTSRIEVVSPDKLTS
jgi:RES domain-containing protein